MKKNFYYFLLLFPLIDFITSIGAWNNFTSLGTIIKGGLLLCSSIYLILHSKNKKETYIIFSTIILYLLLHIICVGTEGITSLIKIFYFPIMLYFFYMYNNIYNHQYFQILYDLRFLGKYKYN